MVWCLQLCATSFLLCAATLFLRDCLSSTEVPLLLVVLALLQCSLLEATGDHQAIALKALASLFPGLALAFDVDTIDVLEDAGVGLW